MSLKPRGSILHRLVRGFALLVTSTFVACLGSTNADVGCPTGLKVCGSQCLTTADPALGCAQEGCAPCALPHAASTCDSSGRCAATACALGYGDCDLAPTNGCERSLSDDPANCGACAQACAGGEICRGATCVSADAPRVDAWLATQRGGFCDASFNQLVTLCNNTMYTGTDSEFCFDETLLGLYPRGIELHVGFHWDGASTGHIANLGGDCDGASILAVITPERLLQVSGPVPAGFLQVRIPAGTHLLSYRVDALAATLFIDGVVVARGAGTGGPTPELITRCGPGIVLGGRFSYWWEATPAQPTGWLRYAPFFVHLRDASAGEPTHFSLDSVLSPGPDTRLLFDSAGVQTA